MKRHRIPTAGYGVFDEIKDQFKKEPQDKHKSILERFERELVVRRDEDDRRRIVMFQQRVRDVDPAAARQCPVQQGRSDEDAAALADPAGTRLVRAPERGAAATRLAGAVARALGWRRALRSLTRCCLMTLL